MVTRRRLLESASTLGIAAALAGCSAPQSTDTPPATSSATSSPTASATPTASTTPTGTQDGTGTAATRVDVGPEGRLRFVPQDIEVSLGDTVEWVALSPGHNVTSHPDAAPRCENPEGAEPFTSYEGDDHFAIMDVDEVFSHEFTVPGEYVYVCTPHAGQGMFGSVTVVE
jgi:plastocyanin